MTRVIDHPVISHHLEQEHYRTILFSTRTVAVRLCARCTGIVLGTLLGLAWLWAGHHVTAWWALLGTLDWLAYRFGLWRGITLIRIVSGMLLGSFQALILDAVAQWQVSSAVLMTGCFLLSIYIIGGMSRISYDDDGRLCWHGWRTGSRFPHRTPPLETP